MRHFIGQVIFGLWDARTVILWFGLGAWLLWRIDVIFLARHRQLLAQLHELKEQIVALRSGGFGVVGDRAKSAPGDSIGDLARHAQLDRELP